MSWQGVTNPVMSWQGLGFPGGQTLPWQWHHRWQHPAVPGNTQSGWLDWSPSPALAGLHCLAAAGLASPLRHTVPAGGSRVAATNINVDVADPCAVQHGRRCRLPSGHAACPTHTTRRLSTCRWSCRQCVCQWPAKISLPGFALRGPYPVLVMRGVKNGETRSSLCVANMAGGMAVIHAVPCNDSDKRTREAGHLRDQLLAWAKSRVGGWCACGSRRCSRIACPHWQDWLQLRDPDGYRRGHGWMLVEIGRTKNAAKAQVQGADAADLDRIAKVLGVSRPNEMSDKEFRESIGRAVDGMQRFVYQDARLEKTSLRTCVEGRLPTYVTHIRAVRPFHGCSAYVCNAQPGGFECEVPLACIDIDTLTDRQARMVYQRHRRGRGLCKACLVLFECHVDLERDPCRKCHVDAIHHVGPC
jgi:hypothetical protein